MTNLTTAQQTILETAAGRADGSIHPLPDHIKGGAAKKVIKALRNGGMIDDTDCITTLGRNAVDPDQTDSEQIDETTTTPEQPVEADALATSEGPLDLGTDEGAAAWNANMPEDAKAYHEEMNAASEEPDGPDDYDEPPCSIFCPMDPADLVQPNADEGPADMEDTEGDFEEDVHAAEQAMAETGNLNALLEADEKYLQIARKHSPEEFRTTNNWPWVKSMIEEAYTLGYVDAEKHCTMMGHADAKKKNPAPRQSKPTDTPRRTRENTKQAQVIAMLRRSEGATLTQIAEVTGWTQNTIRGALAGALKKKLGLNVVRMPHTAGGTSTYKIEG